MEISMATIVVRNLPEDVKKRLVDRAHAHKRSMEAEVRFILEETVMPEPTWVQTWMTGADELRRKYGGIDLDIPERTDMGRDPIDFE